MIILLIISLYINYQLFKYWKSSIIESMLLEESHIKELQDIEKCHRDEKALEQLKAYKQSVVNFSILEFHGIPFRHAVEIQSRALRNAFERESLKEVDQLEKQIINSLDD